jgi:hypothetical protein
MRLSRAGMRRKGIFLPARRKSTGFVSEKRITKAQMMVLVVMRMGGFIAAEKPLCSLYMMEITA